MTDEMKTPSFSGEPAKPYYVPFRSEQANREDRYAHVAGKDYKIIKTAVDRNNQEHFQYVDSDISFFIVATQYFNFDRDSPERSHPHFDYYQVTNWPLKEDTDGVDRYIFPGGALARYKERIEESLFLFDSDTKRVQF